MLKKIIGSAAAAILALIAFPRLFCFLPISSEWIGPVKDIENYESYLSSKQSVVLREGYTLTLKENARTIRPLTLAFLKDARICYPHGFVITERDCLYADNANDWNYRKIEDLKLFNRLFLPRVQTYYNETVVVATTKGGECYYHWMTEVIPKLIIIKNRGIAFDKVYLPKITKNFQIETLNKLGIDKEQWIESSCHTMIKAKKVIVLSRPGACGWADHAVEPWVMEGLKELMLSHDHKPCRKIYISRKKATRRRVVNEAELCRMLERYNFETLCLEDLTVEEQAAVFNEASVIIAPHGAGLTNLVFSHPGITLLEFYHPEHTSDCYSVLASQKQISHYKVFLTPSGDCKDGIIDVPQVETLLRGLG